MSQLTEILEALAKTLGDRIALTVIFICVLLVITAHLFSSTALGDWITAHIVWVYLSGLFSLCYLPTRHIIDAMDRFIAERRERTNLEKQLQLLGEDEKELLYSHIASKHMAFLTGFRDQHIAKSLEKRGIVFETLPHSFTIDKTAFEYLLKHPGLVDIEKKP